MGVDGIGSSVMIAAAALLWLVYLVPTWLRRREYLATERNAIRLQQTLRIMAETAEVPAQVRAETSARSAAQHERLLKKEFERQEAVARAQDAAAARAATRRLAETQPAIAADIALTSSASRRLRRSRAITSFIMVASVGAAAAGVAQLLSTGAWLLLASGSLVTIGSVAMLGQMAAVGRARAELASTLRARPPVAPRAPQRVVVPAVPVQSTWTPVPVPKPRYATMPKVERSLITSLDAAAELRQAAADAERALREAHAAPEVTPIRRSAVAAPASPAASSRFARMGIVDEPTGGTTDIDAVLRRRRVAAAG
jgi:hypothetical protein